MTATTRLPDTDDLDDTDDPYSVAGLDLTPSPRARELPRVALQVIDRAIQVHGGAGVSDDVPLTAMYGWHRAMRIFDGPEVHLRTIAETELGRGSVLAPRPVP